MQIIEGNSNRRNNERLNLSFQISLPDRDGQTINISSGGVYFEVITKDMKTFSPGTIIPLKINASIATFGSKERDLKLMGQGTIVRNDIRGVSIRGNKLGVAMEFKDKLDIFIDAP